MSVKKDPSGRRSVQVEVEVPGTPEQVWEAIATGPGVSSWFVPTRVESDKDGKPVRVISDFGPGMESVATVTAWDPPHRYTDEGPSGAPDAPPMATEWIVEARSGGTCVVRVVHSLFTDRDDWDGQLESTESGWPGFFRILRLYLSHFRGQPCTLIQMMSAPAESEPKAWQTLSAPLGLENVKEGHRWKAPAGLPPLAGVIENVGVTKSQHMLLVRLDEPVPGTAMLGSFACGGMAMVQISLYLYGDKAVAAAARDKPLWEKWLTEKFPAPPA